jgi:hypothetical protein
MPGRRLYLHLLLFLALPIWAQDQSRLPSWFDFSIEQRSRVEGLHRTQLRVRVLTTPTTSTGSASTSAFSPRTGSASSVRVQDSREAGRRKPVPAKVENPFDIRGAHVEVGKLDRGWLLRAGRQELQYGGARLLGPGPWSNVPRVFDAARVAYRGDRFRLEWFAGTRVTPDADDFDGVSDDDRIAGFYPSLPSRSEGNQSSSPSSSGKGFATSRPNPEPSAARTPTPAASGSPARSLSQFSYAVEAALQRGDQAGDPLSAWATYAAGEPPHQTRARQRPPPVRVRLRLRRLRPHRRPRRNLRSDIPQQPRQVRHRRSHGLAQHARPPRRRPHPDQPPLERERIDYHSFWLATLEDALYRANGSVIVRNPTATSRHAFQELDASTVLQVARPLDLYFGYAHIFPGRFLKDSTGGSPSTYAYAQLVLTIAP